MQKDKLKVLRDMIPIRIGQQDENLTLLKELKIKKRDDRLLILRNWTHLHKILSDNLASWGSMLEDKELFQTLDREQLKELYDTFWEFVEAFINFDIYAVEEFYEKITKIVGEEKEPNYIG